jgi:anti-anti-sigma regulatory factor
MTVTTGMTVSSEKSPIERLAVNTIRTLAMDAVQAANSGHPGTPMALAPVAYTLWQRFLRFDPDDPTWPNRDRFVLSNGHASMLLYALLHLAGVKAVNAKYEHPGELAVTLDDIKRFREIGSKCPGHPEYRLTSGVETTTGPLGQGCANSVGMALAALLYIYRVAETTTVAPVTHEYLRDGLPHILQDKEIPANVTILRIHGPFLFGATEKLMDATRDIHSYAPVVIVRLRNMTALDATGMHALEHFADRLHKAGKTVLFCGARDQPARLLSRPDFVEHIGPENILPHVQAALARAREINSGFDGVGWEFAEDLAAKSL